MNRREFLGVMSLLAASPLSLAGTSGVDALLSDPARVNEFFPEELERYLADKCWKSAHTPTHKVHPRFHRQLVLPHAELNTLLANIAQPLFSAAHRRLHWRIAVLNDPEINAFTPGGGVTYVTFGFLLHARTQYDLLGVIAHEIGHNEHHHAAKRIALSRLLKEYSMQDILANRVESKQFDAFIQNLNYLAHKSYKRLHEFEADAYILNSFIKAGIGSKQAPACNQMLVSLFGSQRLGKNTCLYGSHPQSVERLERMKFLASQHEVAQSVSKEREFLRIKKIITQLVKQSS